VLVLTASEVEQVLDLDALAAALERALRAVSDGSASVPPRVGAVTSLGMLGAMPGHVPGVGLGAKLVTYFPRNAERELPGHQAVVVLADPDDGRLVAMMDGTYITAVRTAMTAAVAARALAGADVATVAVVGTGVQARSHLEAFGRLFPDAACVVTGRSSARAADVAAAHAGVEAVASIEDAVRSADIACLCTDSAEPVILRDWLPPGCHVSSVGSGVEVDVATVDAASVFVESRAMATQPFPAGSRELAGRDPDSVTEVGEVLLGSRPGRRSGEELTLYKSMGHASEDVAAAALAYEVALTRGVGASIAL
jgi:alanine dehydrogenase